MAVFRTFTGRNLFGQVLIFLALVFLSGFFRPVTAQTDFDGDRAYEDLLAQCDLGTREPGSAGAQQAILLFRDILKPLADEFHLQHFQLNDPYSSGTLDLTNIVARFQPSKNDRILLCAHWDSRPRGEYDLYFPQRPIPGANDGASGVAVLLEIARQLARNPTNPGIDIVLFDGED